MRLLIFVCLMYDYWSNINN